MDCWSTALQDLGDYFDMTEEIVFQILVLLSLASLCFQQKQETRETQQSSLIHGFTFCGFSYPQPWSEKIKWEFQE